MSKQVQNFIDDARRFQRCSDHDLAISSLQLAQQEDHHKEHEIEIQKLFSLSYRKIGNYNMALFLLETDNWYAIPTMGSLTVGYILLVTKQHYLSLANLDSNLFFEMLNLKKSVEDFLFKKLGMHCIAFEHGTTNSYSTGANSVDHVHLHILPFSRPVWNEIITNIPATTVNTVESYNDLFEVWKKNIPDTYLLFQDLDQKLYYISDSSYMPSQLFRKCLAPYLGANYWDWRSESYSNNILETISLFKGIIE